MYFKLFFFVKKEDSFFSFISTYFQILVAREQALNESLTTENIVQILV